MIIGEISVEQVLQALDMAVKMNGQGGMSENMPNYMDENISLKGVKIIQSHTGIVNKMV
ncbi:hypothetical protein MASR2M29_03740 [Spirochaetota bacterium]